ncbi:RsaA secretion system, ATP-binding protein RsaD [Phenylobacterium zucineum HLK1]|uniref:RsaA secretion system, ATP-binding protein RsaD n=1 Tax=Phenylobacterium zucineum (strain HLK1) TaxID=450851 RepID=B4REG0_PHEZH|nr:type I secretion system permease/ATPase [Phenylobacterium zucineum]ACG76902.1 RsaA secretion system, ATP-binding protein RsaD [Phenylobacterium zucineum HLK1]
MKFLTFLANQPDNVLTRSLSDFKRVAVWAFSFSLVSNLLYMALPLYTFQVYGRVLVSHSQATLWMLTIVTLFVFVISSVIDDLRARILINYGVALDQRVSGRVFASLFDAAVRGEPGARAQALRDLDQFRQTLTGVGAAALFDAPWIPVFLVVLFIIDPLVGTITLVGALILLGLAIAQTRAMQRPLQEAQDSAFKSYGFTEAALRNGEVVRAMGMLPTLGAAWARHRAVTIEAGATSAEYSNFYTDIIKSVRLGIQVLIIAVGAYLIIEGKIHMGMLFANMILASRALQPIEKIVATWEPLNNMVRAHERLQNLLSKAEPPPPATSLPRPAGKLSVEGVNFAPPGAPKLVLAGVSFSVEPGEVLGVIGPSGAGKSTLARLLVGIWRPLQGVVRLDGADVFAWDRADFGRYVGYLPQDTELFAGTIRDNIARFRADITDEEVVQAARLAGVHELILRMAKGYDTEIGEGGAVLSVGQRQRVGLARAMLGAPAFVVLDEPNANLDAEGEDALVRAIDTMKAAGSTVVIISHRPAVFRSADKIVMLREGRVEMFGPRDQVMARLVKPAADVRAVEGGR